MRLSKWWEDYCFNPFACWSDGLFLSNLAPRVQKELQGFIMTVKSLSTQHPVMNISPKSFKLCTNTHKPLRSLKLWNSPYGLSLTQSFGFVSQAACVKVTQVARVRLLTFNLYLGRKWHLLFPVTCLSGTGRSRYFPSQVPVLCTSTASQTHRKGPGEENRAPRCQFPWLPFRMAARSFSDHDSLVGLVCYYCYFLWLTATQRCWNSWTCWTVYLYTFAHVVYRFGNELTLFA